MPSKIEAELLKATGQKVRTKRDQRYLGEILDAVQKLKDPDWAKLSKPAQKWANAAQRADTAKLDIDDFPDVEEDGEREPARERASDRERSDRSERSERGSDAKGKGKDKDADEEKDKDEGRRGSTRQGRGGSKDDEKDKDRERGSERGGRRGREDEGSSRGKDREESSTRSPRGSTGDDGKIEGVKVNIKKCVIENPKVSVDEIFKKLGGTKAKMSRVTISNIRADFRHSLKVLQQEGHLKGITI